MISLTSAQEAHLFSFTYFTFSLVFCYICSCILFFNVERPCICSGMIWMASTLVSLRICFARMAFIDWQQKATCLLGAINITFSLLP